MDHREQYMEPQGNFYLNMGLYNELNRNCHKFKAQLYSIIFGMFYVLLFSFCNLVFRVSPSSLVESFPALVLFGFLNAPQLLLAN